MKMNKFLALIISLCLAMTSVAFMETADDPEIIEIEEAIVAEEIEPTVAEVDEIELGELLFDGRTRQFFLSGKLMSLTPREHAVLEHLIFKAGTTVSKTVLCESVFGFNDLADANAIEIYVHRVRKKLEGSSVKIATLRGMGYLLRHGE